MPHSGSAPVQRVLRRATTRHGVLWDLGGLLCCRGAGMGPFHPCSARGSFSHD